MDMGQPRKKTHRPDGRAKPGERSSARSPDAEIAVRDFAAVAPGLTPGVYNYCDRWCARCPLTARCLVFRTDQQQRSAAGQTAADASKERFWDGIALCFATAIQLIRRDAKIHGIDLDSPELQDELQHEERRRRTAAARVGGILRRTSTAYWKGGGRLLKALPATLDKTSALLETEVRLGVGNPRATVEEISEALEVVQWYLLFIEVKLRRAVNSYVDEQRDGIDGTARDSDGSAKVALVAIDRSLAAWARLREHFAAEHGDAILDLLVLLERLRRSTEAKFPNARAFQRPGFD